MRILVLNDLYPPTVRGGYEVECRDVVEHLRQLHEVTVLTSDWHLEEVEVEQAHVWRELPWTGDGSRAESISAARDAAKGARVARAALRRAQPDAIYVWNGAGVPAAALRVLQLSGIPMLARICEHWFGQVYRSDQFTRHLVTRPRTGVRGAWDRTMRAANALPGLRVDLDEALPVAVCWNSRFVRDQAGSTPQFERRHEDFVIPSNARTARMLEIERRPEPGRLLFVGRLDETKGAHTLVLALGELEREHGRRATLRLVGPGTEADRARLKTLADQEGVGERVSFLGRLDGSPLEHEVSAAAAWCVPSVWAEPAPMTAVEAAAARVPAVLSRVGGIPEVLREPSEAVFHAPEDATGCAAALAEVLRGGPEVEARTRAAHQRALQLGFGPYLEAMDRFARDGLAALGA